MSAWSDKYIAPFLRYLRFEKRYSAHTAEAYQTDLRDFEDYINLQYDIQALQDVLFVHIRSWLAALKEQDLSAKTIKRKISALKSFYKFQIKIGEVIENPMVKVIAPKVSKRLPIYIKENDIDTLRTSMAAYSEDWKSFNAYVIINLFYATGMRLSELIQLKESNIDVGRKQIKVLGKGNKERNIPIGNDLINILEEYIREKRKAFHPLPEELLVTEKGKKLYSKYAYLLVKKYLETIPTLDKKSPHVLRHTFATHLVNNGAEINAVKELLGHSSLSATQVYTHNSIEKLKEIYKKAHPKA